MSALAALGRQIHESMMLTNAGVRAARPKPRAYKLADASGLHLYVAPTGCKSFRMRFRVAGKEQLLTFGTWPEISLDAARVRCAEAREQLRRGADPRMMQPRSREVHSFEEVARRWHEHMRRRWTEVHAGDVLASLQRDVFPAIGAMPLPAITVPVVLNALRSVEQRGRLETAQRVRQRISAVFRFAMAERLVTSNPAIGIADALTPPDPQCPQPALLDLADARALLVAVDQLGAAPAITLASRFLALTAARLAAVRGARWGEIEDIDGPSPLWRIPAARMKLKVAKKLDPRNDHLVPLSTEAVAVLRAAREMHRGDANMHDGLIFPGRGGGAPIGEAAIGALYDRAGFAGRHVPHGWRATFATILNEQMPEERYAIDAALAHAPKDKVEAAYNRSEQLDRRRRLFDAWGALIAPPVSGA